LGRAPGVGVQIRAHYFLNKKCGLKEPDCGFVITALCLIKFDQDDSTENAAICDDGYECTKNTRNFRLRQKTAARKQSWPEKQCHPNIFGAAMSH
jgi:hypothetical protein